MAGESPSSILSRAADLIRDAAALAVAPPWSQCGRSVMHGPDEEHEVALTPTTRTAAWIKMMSPDKAEHVEAWLRGVAARLEAWLPTGWPIREDEAAAIRFALSVLGMTVEEAERG